MILSIKRGITIVYSVNSERCVYLVRLLENRFLLLVSVYEPRVILSAVCMYISVCVLLIYLTRVSLVIHQ